MEQNSNMEKIYLDWQYIDDAITNLAHQIKSSELNIEYILGIPRGGLILAVMLSHKLNIPLFRPGMVLNNKVLIVDDICDSGLTLQKYNIITTAVIHYKQSAKIEPNFYYSLTPEDKWIVYPWERADSKTIQDYATKGE
jgi:hypoxanthine phosphoribosyltransferase